MAVTATCACEVFASRRQKLENQQDEHVRPVGLVWGRNEQPGLSRITFKVQVSQRSIWGLSPPRDLCKQMGPAPINNSSSLANL